MTGRDGPIDEKSRFVSGRLTLRLVLPGDCGERYLGWLEDPMVNRHLETRWHRQDLESIRAFVTRMYQSPDSHLLAIVLNDGSRHVGNLKIGPVSAVHGHADLSYFIGERSFWGLGIATEAIHLAASVAFGPLGLHRLQAGVYESNVGSCRALEKAGFRLEGRFRKQLRGGDGWEDHLWYGLLAEDWKEAGREKGNTAPPATPGAE